MVEVRLRQAREADFPAIRALIRQVRINPTGLDWRRFIVAVLPSDEIIACGQVKPVPGELWELASLAVVSDYRRHGIASAIIKRLLAGASRPMYLTCRSSLGGFYKRFGFKNVDPEATPRYYRRLQKLAGAFIRFSGSDEHLLVMKLD